MRNAVALPLGLLLAAGVSDRVAAEMGNTAAGESVFLKCAACHEVGEGAQHRVGPHLNGLFGRSAAGAEGFGYSESLQRAGAGGLEWHAETLDAFLENPRALASGTRMKFPGLENPQERADVIAYLRDFSASPAEIPEADPTASGTDHDLDPAILALKGDPEYGAYLAGECTTCHQAGGGDEGIPSIVHWPEDDFVVAMQAYKRKIRPNAAMQMIAARLNDEEIAALAAYFADVGE